MNDAWDWLADVLLELGLDWEDEGHTWHVPNFGRITRTREGWEVAFGGHVDRPTDERFVAELENFADYMRGDAA